MLLRCDLKTNNLNSNCKMENKFLIAFYHLYKHNIFTTSATNYDIYIPFSSTNMQNITVYRF